MGGWRDVVLTDGVIDPVLFAAAADRFMVVASCSCGGVMRPLPVETVNGVAWYGARCENCAGELQAPNGKTRRTPPLPRTRRRSKRELVTVGTPQFPSDLINTRRPGERDAN